MRPSEKSRKTSGSFSGICREVEPSSRSASRPNFTRVVEDRQRDQPEEVHLEEAHPVDGLHLELGRDLVVVVPVEREVLDERPRRDEDPGRVDARVPRDPLEPLAQVEEPPVRLVPLRARPRAPSRCRRASASVTGLPGFAGIIAQSRFTSASGTSRTRPDVADHGPRLHRVERDDLADVVPAVLLPDVLDDLAAAALAEVDVDVGHRDPVGVQEPLEEEVVARAGRPR